MKKPNKPSTMQNDDPFLLDSPILDESKKGEYELLIPSMMNIHMRVLASTLESMGYHTTLLTSTAPELIQEGLRYVHNDSCYPLVCVAGQFIHQLKQMKDTSKVALAMTQTGGGCRATNYVPILRKALINAGFGHVPFLLLHLGNPFLSKGIKITFSFLKMMVSAISYGDMLMYLFNQTRSYEVNPGESNKLVDEWVHKLSLQYQANKGQKSRYVLRNLKQMVKDFSILPLVLENKPKVGIVGEIYVKYSPLGNNNLEEFLVKEGAEIKIPGLFTFILFCFQNQFYDHYYYGGRFKLVMILKPIFWYFQAQEAKLNKALKNSNFPLIARFQETKKFCNGVIKHGAKMGEGWLLTAEMMELNHEGYPNIVCTQPFGCLPNHICGKGVIKRIRTLNPDSNIVPIDYDASGSRVNQENRLRLMLAVAKEKISN